MARDHSWDEIADEYLRAVRGRDSGRLHDGATAATDEQGLHTGSCNHFWDTGDRSGGCSVKIAIITHYS